VCGKIACTVWGGRGWKSAMENLIGHETGNGGYSQGDTYGNSPSLDPTMSSHLRKHWTLQSFLCENFLAQCGKMGYTFRGHGYVSPIYQ
jgi:hypothetical protein